MSSLSEYTLARNIWHYAGKKLEYIDLTGKKGTGTLVGMQVHEETRETIALFRVSLLSVNFCHEVLKTLNLICNLFCFRIQKSQIFYHAYFRQQKFHSGKLYFHPHKATAAERERPTPLVRVEKAQ